MLAERVGQRRDLGRVELAPRLEWVGVDLIDGQVDQVGAVERAGLESAFLAAEQGFQAAAESSLIHGR